MMERLAAASNLWDQALLLLHSAGYALFSETHSFDGEEWDLWVAEKDDLRLEAENPIALLGLVNIREKLGKDWRLVDCSKVNEIVVEREPSRDV